jgi:DNA-binding transcriptional regulator YiaG
VRDAALLARAIAASGLSQARFAVEVMGVDESTLRRWLMAPGTPSARAMPGPAVKLCERVLADYSSSSSSSGTITGA